MGVFGETKPGCDRDFLNFSRLASCGAKLGAGRTRRQNTTKTLFFGASDSSPTDAWFRSHVPGVVQSEGAPVHTGREVLPEERALLGKVYIDYFALSRASVLVANCAIESTFQSSAKLLRDARGLPTYRALDCHHLAPFPQFERSHVFWMQSDGWLWMWTRERPWVEVLGAAVIIGGLVMLCRCFMAWRRAAKEHHPVPDEED